MKAIILSFAKKLKKELIEGAKNAGSALRH